MCTVHLARPSVVVCVHFAYTCECIHLRGTVCVGVHLVWPTGYILYSSMYSDIVPKQALSYPRWSPPRLTVHGSVCLTKTKLGCTSVIYKDAPSGSVGSMFALQHKYWQYGVFNHCLSIFMNYSGENLRELHIFNNLRRQVDQSFVDHFLDPFIWTKSLPAALSWITSWILPIDSPWIPAL